MNATEATRQVFPILPTEFYGVDLIQRVRVLTDRPFMYDETPLRKMRLLFHGQYELIDKLHSKYRKVNGGNGSSILPKSNEPTADENLAGVERCGVPDRDVTRARGGVNPARRHFDATEPASQVYKETLF